MNHHIQTPNFSPSPLTRTSNLKSVHPPPTAEEAHERDPGQDRVPTAGVLLRGDRPHVKEHELLQDQLRPLHRRGARGVYPVQPDVAHHPLPGRRRVDVRVPRSHGAAQDWRLKVFTDEFLMWLLGSAIGVELEEETNK